MELAAELGMYVDQEELFADNPREAPQRGSISRVARYEYRRPGGEGKKRRSLIGKTAGRARSVGSRGLG